MWGDIKVRGKFLPGCRQSGFLGGNMFSPKEKGKNKQDGKRSQHFPLKERKTVKGKEQVKEELLCRLVTSYCPFCLMDSKSWIYLLLLYLKVILICSSLFMCLLLNYACFHVSIVFLPIKRACMDMDFI